MVMVVMVNLLEGNCCEIYMLKNFSIEKRNDDDNDDDDYDALDDWTDDVDVDWIDLMILR